MTALTVDQSLSGLAAMGYPYHAGAQLGSWRGPCPLGCAGNIAGEPLRISCGTPEMGRSEGDMPARLACDSGCDAHAIEARLLAALDAEGFPRFPRFPRTPADWPAPMNEAAMYGLVGELVRAISPHTEADPAALTVSLLVAAGAAMGRGVGARAEGDFHGTNLFAAVVGQSSKARKGTTMGRVSQVLELADPAFMGRIVGGLSSGEGLLWQVRDPIERKRKAKTKAEREEADEDGYIVEIEDHGVDDKRLLVSEGELAQVLRTMRRESNTLSAILRNLWDRGDMRSLTKSNPVKVTGGHVAVLGHITIDELRKELSATDAANGFANRFLWVAARRSKLLPDGGCLSSGVLEPLAHELALSIRAASVGVVLDRDAEARELWHAVYGSLSEGHAGLFGSVTSRAEAQVLRLSVIYAALDLASAIKAKHLLAALAVWDYSERSALHIFGDTLGDAVAEQIREALAQTEDGLSRTAIRDMFGRHEPSAKIDQALQKLADRGLAEGRRIPTGGRPTELWRLKPDAATSSTDRPEWVRYLPDCAESDKSAARVNEQQPGDRDQSAKSDQTLPSAFDTAGDWA